MAGPFCLLNPLNWVFGAAFSGFTIAKNTSIAQCERSLNSIKSPPNCGGLNPIHRIEETISYCYTAIKISSGEVQTIVKPASRNNSACLFAKRCDAEGIFSCWKAIMEFIPVAAPQSESELAVMVCLLEANGIQHYVHNQGFGGLYPGMQLDLYNARRLMVVADQAPEALELLSAFLPASDPLDSGWRMTPMDKMRALIELAVFGWAFPSKRERVAQIEDDEA